MITLQSCKTLAKGYHQVKGIRDCSFYNFVINLKLVLFGPKIYQVTISHQNIKGQNKAINEGMNLANYFYSQKRNSFQIFLCGMTF